MSLVVGDIESCAAFLVAGGDIGTAIQKGFSQLRVAAEINSLSRVSFVDEPEAAAVIMIGADVFSYASPEKHNSTY